MINISRPTRSAMIAAGLVVAAGCQSAVEPIPRIEALPRNLTAAEERVITSSNAFAFELLREVNDGSRGENVFISPLSVSMALGVTMNGAVDRTFEEIRSTLGYGELSQGEINAAYRGLLDLLPGLDRSVEIHVANSVWHRDEFSFERAFFNTVENDFDARVRGIDFADPASVTTINGWVHDQTRGRIPTILDDIPSEMVMYLINAVYFNGKWTDPFDRSATRQRGFTLEDGGSVEVPMMSNDGNYRYTRRPDLTAIDLPYGSGAFSMTIIIPETGRSVEEEVGLLTPERWSEIVEGFASGRMIAELPRFRIEYEKALVEPLKALGMEAPFAPGLADFSGMSATHGKDLVISEVKHKTFVDVNEEGTEAAGVTSVGVALTSMPPVITADRPFVFVIRERFSGTILFIGKVADPTAG